MEKISVTRLPYLERGVPKLNYRKDYRLRRDIKYFCGITRSKDLREDIIQKIIHPDRATKKVTKLKLDKLVEEQEMFECLKTTTTLDDVVLHPKIRTVIGYHYQSSR